MPVVVTSQRVGPWGVAKRRETGVGWDGGGMVSPGGRWPGAGPGSCAGSVRTLVFPLSDRKQQTDLVLKGSLRCWVEKRSGRKGEERAAGRRWR